MDDNAVPLRPGYYQTNTGGKEHVTTRVIHDELSSYSVLPDGSDDTHGMTGWFDNGIECHDLDNGHLLLETWEPCLCHPVMDFILEELAYKVGSPDYEYMHVNLPKFPDVFKQRLLDEIERRKADTIHHLDYCRHIIEAT